VPVGKGVSWPDHERGGPSCGRNGPDRDGRNAPDSPVRSLVDEQVTQIAIQETGIKVVDLIAPFMRGGKIGFFGGAVWARRSL